jgi:hypothetical protein
MRRRFLLVILACLTLAACGGGYHGPSATGSHHPPGWGRPLPGVSLPRLTLQPTASMFDTIDLGQLNGLRPVALAGYTAGRWPTYLGLVRAYAHAIVKSIAIASGYHAMCLDVEPGDAAPAQAAAWVRADIRAGFSRPCVYSSLWEFVNQVRPDLARAGISRSSVWEWDADYRGCNGTIDSSFDATQCTARAYGRNLDQSTATLGFLGIHPKPAPLLICYHHRLSRLACAAARARVASDRRAVAQSRQALIAARRDLARDRCRTPYRRGLCVRRGRDAGVFAQRIAYFTAQIGRVEATA